MASSKRICSIFIASPDILPGSYPFFSRSLDHSANALIRSSQQQGAFRAHFSDLMRIACLTLPLTQYLYGCETLRDRVDAAGMERMAF